MSNLLWRILNCSRGRHKSPHFITNEVLKERRVNKTHKKVLIHRIDKCLACGTVFENMTAWTTEVI